jgi:hypothetical protein
MRPMKRRMRTSAWTRTFQRNLAALSHCAIKSGTRALGKALEPARVQRKPPTVADSWLPGVAMGATGTRRFRLYRPPDMKFGERLPRTGRSPVPGCGRDAQKRSSSWPPQNQSSKAGQQGKF